MPGWRCGGLVTLVGSAALVRLLSATPLDPLAAKVPSVSPSSFLVDQGVHVDGCDVVDKTGVGKLLLYDAN